MGSWRWRRSSRLANPFGTASPICRNSSSERVTPSVWAISNSTSRRGVPEVAASATAASRKAAEIGLSIQGREALGLVLGDQRVDQFAQAWAFEDFGQAVQRQ